MGPESIHSTVEKSPGEDTSGKPLTKTSAKNTVIVEKSRSARRFRRQLRQLLRGQPLGSVQYSIVVADADSGKVWAQVNPNKTLVPASTIKLFTSAVALDRQGADKRFVTQVLVLKSKVYIRGGGDPQLSLAALRQLVVPVVDALGTQIEQVVVDDSVFTGGVLPPGFDAKKTDAYYRASTGALAVMEGTTRIEVRPARSGRPGRVSVSPPGGYVRVSNTSRSVIGPGSTIRIRVVDSKTRSIAQVSGRIGSRHRRPTWAVRRLAHPPLAAGYAFRAMLEKRCGCRVKGGVVLDKTPNKARVVAQHRSKPLLEILSKMNKESNNFIAETILRGLVHGGRVGTVAGWDDGVETVERWIRKKLGLQEKSFVYKNGSGLYDGGRFSAGQVVALLVFMNRHRLKDSYRGTLAICGRDGTLSKRLSKTQHAGRVVAKTGTLNSVSALSGYARNRAGRRMAFSILMNNTGGATKRMRSIQDLIAKLVVASH
jgi:D-alanyl-D-alanine carboxypeptidase/D-alanyl-D-alanine-endopeptidase (penicillin-binding protein 4)